MNYFYFVVSWLFFWLGDMASKVLKLFDNSETWVAIWYPLYNKLMLCSSYIQDKAEPNTLSWPWSNV